MKAAIGLLLTVLALAGCGGSPETPPVSPKQSIGNDAVMSVQTIYSPNHGSNIECVVVTAQGTYGRAASISCDWP